MFSVCVSFVLGVGLSEDCAWGVGAGRVSLGDVTPTLLTQDAPHAHATSAEEGGDTFLANPTFGQVADFGYVFLFQFSLRILASEKTHARRAWRWGGVAHLSRYSGRILPVSRSRGSPIITYRTCPRGGPCSAPHSSHGPGSGGSPPGGKSRPS